MIQRKYVAVSDGQYYQEQECTDHGLKTPINNFNVLCNIGGTLHLFV
jgi:hypothetical protein